jgi:hypothetical protein
MFKNSFEKKSVLPPELLTKSEKQSPTQPEILHTLTIKKR